jgi:enoyl-[acyl-carrier-protein] reductase (NADH)
VELVKSLAAKEGRTDLGAEELEAQSFAKHRRPSLLQRSATAQEIADMLLYFASDLSSATNGAGVRVEGGHLRSIT